MNATAILEPTPTAVAQTLSGNSPVGAALMDWATLIVLALTFVAILWYSYETRKLRIATGRMAEETQKQAEASHQMAEESRNAQLNSLRPVLVFRPLGKRDQPYSPDTVTAWGDDIRADATRLDAEIHNIGVGPALNIKCRLLTDNGQVTDFVKERDLGSLEVGAWRQVVLEIKGGGELPQEVMFFKPPIKTCSKGITKAH